MAAAAASASKLVLYSYWRSSCSQRIRIALNLKGLKYEYRAVNLLKGEQFGPDYDKLNPIHFVPTLVDGDVVISDSFAIILYLEEKYPQHALLPVDLKKRALNFQVSSIVSSSIQPLQNISVLNFIQEKVNSDEKTKWAQHHIGKGFAAIEKLLEGASGTYATGDDIAMADVFLAPQINAGLKRFNVDMDAFPILARINEAYDKLPAFQDALPEHQMDFPNNL